MIDLQLEFDALFDEPTCLRPIADLVQAMLTQAFRQAGDAQGQLSDAARQDMCVIIRQRLCQVLYPSLAELLRDHMDRREFLECIVLENSAGPMAKERIRQFGEAFDEAELARLYARVPLLEGFVERVAGGCVDFLSEFLRRYRDKREEISARLFGGHDAGKIVSLSAATRYRQHGRTVIRVVSEAGCLFYKPRDCRVDAFFSDLVGTYFSDISTSPKFVIGDGFAFCSEIVAMPVEREADIGRYFYNYGALAALCFSLNGVDIHGENVIASGVYPSVIDAETLLAPSLASVESAFLTPAERAEQLSVVPMAILPQRSYVRNCQRSALHRSMDSKNLNLPVYNGGSFDVTGHEERFIAGFHEGYLRVLAARADILEALSDCGSMTVRSLHVISSFYDVLLARLLLPENLRSHERQDEVFARLSIGSKARGRSPHKDVVSYEKRCLLGGGVPHFCADVHSRDFCGDGTSDVLVKGDLEKTPFDGVRDKLASLSEEELAMEEKLIRMGLARALYDDGRSFDEPLGDCGVAFDQEDLEAELLDLLRKIREDGIVAPDRTLFWRSANLTYTGQRPLGHATLQADVMSLCGAVLHAAADGAVREEAASLLELCAGALSAKLRLWVGSDATPTLPPGLMCGLGGVLFGCMFADEVGFPAAQQLTDDMVAFICDRMPCELEKPGLREGVSGLLLPLCLLSPRADASVEQKRLSAIRFLAGRLVPMLQEGACDPKPLSTMDPLAGAAGAGAALAAAQGALGGNCYDACIREAFGAVCDSWNEGICGWYRQKRGAFAKRGGYAAGIGLAAIVALKRASDGGERIARCLDVALRSEMAEGMLYRQDILDNGNALRVLFLNAADRCRPDLGYGIRARAIMGHMIGRKRKAGNFIVSAAGLSNGFDPSLLEGSVGIGLAIIDCMRH